jgi:hypothetical protein
MLQILEIIIIVVFVVAITFLVHVINTLAVWNVELWTKYKGVSVIQIKIQKQIYVVQIYGTVVV